MKHCNSTARFLVPVNGTPKGFFNSSRGLRQGNPLSPFLFVLITDVLSRMLKATVDESFLSDFYVGSASHGSVIISHLLFAYDTLMFC